MERLLETLELETLELEIIFSERECGIFEVPDLSLRLSVRDRLGETGV